MTKINDKKKINNIIIMFTFTKRYICVNSSVLLLFNFISRFNLLKSIYQVHKLFRNSIFIAMLLFVNQISPVIYNVDAAFLKTSNILSSESSKNSSRINNIERKNLDNIFLQSPSSSDILFVRHGRSRVRHSNEKDHIRWGLQAFDNLTLDYDIDAFDNDSIVINTGNGNFLFGSDLYALNENNATYLNQSSLVYYIEDDNNESLLSARGNKTLRQNKIIPAVQLHYSIPTQPPLLTTTYPKKKLRKKKIMENIKKNVDKGLEYLKSHKDLDEENIKLPIPVVVVEIKQPYIPNSPPRKQMNSRLEAREDKEFMSEDHIKHKETVKTSTKQNDHFDTIYSSIFQKKNLQTEERLSESKNNQFQFEQMSLINTKNSANITFRDKFLLSSLHNKEVINGSSIKTYLNKNETKVRRQKLLQNDRERNKDDSHEDIAYEDTSFGFQITTIKHIENGNTTVNLNNILNRQNYNLNEKYDNDKKEIKHKMLSLQFMAEVERKTPQKNLQKPTENLQIISSDSNIKKKNSNNLLERNIDASNINLKLNNFLNDNPGNTLSNLINNHHQSTKANETIINNENINNHQRHIIEKYEQANNADDMYDTMNDETFNENTEFGTLQDTIILSSDEANSNTAGVGDSNYDTSIELNLDLDPETKYPGTVKPEDDDYDDISRKNRLNLVKGRDVVTKFLQIVETQHLLGANCKAGTALNLGEGVVDRYAQDRFRVEAEVAVNRANMLTRIFKNSSPEVQASEHLLHASVLSMVAFDDDIFAAGHCFDMDQHPVKSGLFCPFAYRLPPPDQGALLAKDLAVEYHYLGNTSEWFFQARKNAQGVISRNDQHVKAFHLYSNSTEREEDEVLAVKYEDGRWSKPYYDCGGGNIWMLTYTVPFFGFDSENSSYFFKGTSGIDIDLRRVDIDQCPQRYVLGTTTPLNIFAGTDKCKQRTTMCSPIPGLGFRRGSYKCICRKGFYYPDTTAILKYFNGSVLEEEYEKLMLGDNSSYNKALTYECLPCAEGCDYCEDASPCVAALNWPMRTSILVLACAVIGFLPPATWFTFRYQQVKVVRAASPALLRVIALGAFFIYCTTIVMYPNPSLYTCTARVWLREIGFSLTYGALMLKTWRISVIFRVRSAKAVKITDAALLKRLGVICAVIGACLLVRTIVSPPEVVVGRTADDLKAFLCKTDWWDYTFTSMEVLFLAWGVRLCIMVRKAPSEFNESRFISMAIYNEFLLTCFLNVSMLFLQSPANPDLLFIIFFCHTQLTVTLLLGLIFGSKVYIVVRSGKAQDAIAMGAKSSGAKFNFRPQIRTFANPSTSTSTAQMHTADIKLSDQEALEEIRQLSFQLQRIQESAPPKGIAVMTISSLLDSLRTTSQQLSIGGNKTSAVGGSISNALPGLVINDLQKFAQNNNTSTTDTLTTTLNPPKHEATEELPIKTNQSAVFSAKFSEKCVNTSLTGCEFYNGLKDDATSALICSKCSNIIPKVLSCDQIDSPKNNENILSFSNLKLECMCSGPIDNFTERETILISNIQSPIKQENMECQHNYQHRKFCSLVQQPKINDTRPNCTTKSTEFNPHSSLSLRFQKQMQSPPNINIPNSNSITHIPLTTSPNLQHHEDCQKKEKLMPFNQHQKNKFSNGNYSRYSNTVDKISISLNNVAQKLEAHSSKLNNCYINRIKNSKCDNEIKINKNFLICDNCKSELININNEEIVCCINHQCSEYNRIISILSKTNSNNCTSNNETTKIKTKTESNKHKSNNCNNKKICSSGDSMKSKESSNLELNVANIFNTTHSLDATPLTTSSSNLAMRLETVIKRKLCKSIRNDDDISFHSTDDSSCYGDDCTADGGISEGSILASSHYRHWKKHDRRQTNSENSDCVWDDSSLFLQPNRMSALGLNSLTPECDKNNRSIENLNLDDESMNSVTDSRSENEEEPPVANNKNDKVQNDKDNLDDCRDNILISGEISSNNGQNNSNRKRKNKSEKNTLDLNDRSKYSKEVSV